MRTLLTWVLILIISISSNAQSNRCGVAWQDDVEENRIAHQEFLFRVLAHEQLKPVRPRSIRYFPIVFHVVARPGYHPVSEAQVLQQLDVLNQDFSANGENVYRLQDEFKSLIADAEMRFCLAQTDPDGQPTSGITFTTTLEPDIGFRFTDGRRRIHYDMYGGKNGWDPTRYINVWIGECGGLLGTANLPGQAPFDEEIGVVVDIRNFGSIGDAGFYSVFGRGHTLTHEMGHFFGLRHIWGDGDVEDCTNSDDIDDTPNAAGPYFGCPDGEQVSCGTSDMYQNFMDFSDDRCLAAFTHGQVARMQAVAELYYPDLYSESACTQGVNDFEQWFDELTWSTDHASRKIVLYHPSGFQDQIQLRVFSIDGRLVLEKTISDDWTALLDLNHAGAGIFLVQLKVGDDCEVNKVVMW